MLMMPSKCTGRSNGDYHAVERSTKTQKGSSAGFDLFRINELDIPVEVLDLENKNDIIDFSWKPKGHRFDVINGDDPKPDEGCFQNRKSLEAHNSQGKAVRHSSLVTYWMFYYPFRVE